MILAAMRATDGRLVRDQRSITATAVEIIEAIRRRRGRPLAPRDRMALKLLTPRNSALVVEGGVRHLGCRQVSFDILTDDRHRLVPRGVHVFNRGRGWWSDVYGQEQFLWNLYLGESAADGIDRILGRLFGLPVDRAARTVGSRPVGAIAGSPEGHLHLLIERERGRVEIPRTTLLRGGSLVRSRDVGLPAEDGEAVALLFGRERRFGVSFGLRKV